MAYGCGYEPLGGYVDGCVIPPPDTGCGGGYGGSFYAETEYAGASDCEAGGSPPVPTSNIEEICRASCGSTAI